jgi:hypothetical protein
MRTGFGKGLTEFGKGLTEFGKGLAEFGKRRPRLACEVIDTRRSLARIGGADVCR